MQIEYTKSELKHCIHFVRYCCMSICPFPPSHLFIHLFFRCCLNSALVQSNRSEISAICFFFSLFSHSIQFVFTTEHQWFASVQSIVFFWFKPSFSLMSHFVLFAFSKSFLILFFNWFSLLFWFIHFIRIEANICCSVNKDTIWI